MCKRLGVYIGDTIYGYGDTAYVRVGKNTFVWYETIRSLMKNGSDVYDLSIWSLKYGYPTRKGPDAKLKTTELKSIENTVIPIKDAIKKYCVEWEDRTWRIQECTVRYDYSYGYEHVTDLRVDHIGSNACSWEWKGERAMSTLKNATVDLRNRIRVNDLAMTVTIDDAVKESLKKSLEKSTPYQEFRVGGFTTNPDPFKVVKIAEKETKTMEKKTMTETDTFLKHINGITITSTYSKLDFGDFGDPYYIYYPEMDITEDMADTLLTVLLMAKREYIHKVVFNPEKGTTTISCNYYNGPVTVRCKDAEFDYVLGYNMARLKMYLGSNDYNWFNKIKNHCKTHIEYTEKKPTKKGGKK